jgi:hypothetical protein
LQIQPGVIRTAILKIKTKHHEFLNIIPKFCSVHFCSG